MSNMSNKMNEVDEGAYHNGPLIFISLTFLLWGYTE